MLHDEELLVLVTVGTDHHPFQRLVDWIDRWPARPTATVVLQHGTATPIAGAQCHEYLSSSRMHQLLASADAVVCAGGPATVMDARRVGRRPIVVPRVGARGEHVDDHQLSFARHLAEEGLARVVEDPQDLYFELDRMFVDASVHRVAPSGAEPLGVRRVGDMIDSLVRSRS